MPGIKINLNFLNEEESFIRFWSCGCDHFQTIILLLLGK